MDQMQPESSWQADKRLCGPGDCHCDRAGIESDVVKDYAHDPEDERQMIGNLKSADF